MSEVNYELQELADEAARVVVDVQYDDLVTDLYMQMADVFNSEYDF
jgi:hypothetical protein